MRTHLAAPLTALTLLLAAGAAPAADSAWDGASGLFPDAVERPWELFDSADPEEPQLVGDVLVLETSDDPEPDLGPIPPLGSQWTERYFSDVPKTPPVFPIPGSAPTGTILLVEAPSAVPLLGGWTLPLLCFALMAAGTVRSRSRS